MQIYFEQSQNLPGGAYLIAAAQLGVDIQYVLTGMRSSSYTRPEQILVAKYRALSAEQQQEAQTMVAPKHAAPARRRRAS